MIRVAPVVALMITLAVFAGCALRRQPPAEAPTEPPAETPTHSAPASAEPSEPAKPRPAEAPTPTLLSDEGLSRDLILARLLRGRELVDSMAGRSLDPEQRRQIEIGTGFLEEADEALDQEDLGRADVLSEKALVLIEDVAGGG